MASKRIKTFIFENAEKIKHEKVSFLMAVSTEDILVSKKAKHFCKKGELNSIKKSLRWAQSGFCSFNCLEVTIKTINLYPEWLVQQNEFQICETKSPFFKIECYIQCLKYGKLKSSVR